MSTESTATVPARTRPFWIVASTLVLLHMAFVVAAGTRELTFLSGGSDAPAYTLLASNLLHHRGYTYSGEPTAFRPPGYPLFLMTMIVLFGRFYLVATRFVQLLACLGTAWLCGRSAAILFGVGDAAFLIALALPTQVFASAQVLTECTTSFFVTLFLYYFIRELRSPSRSSEIGMGLTAVAGSYLRFNVAALPLLAGLAIIRGEGQKRWTALAYTMLVPVLLLSPWLIRNMVVFNGTVLFSTQGGYNALQGVLTPQGRTQPGDSIKLQNAVGWVMSQLETNDISRLSLPSESALDAQCIGVASRLWKEEGWHAIILLSRKLADFWLSTDQVLDTKSVSYSTKCVRFLGVVVYWAVLVMALNGWRRLHTNWPIAANSLLIYALMFTVFHFPFVMSTRIRFPLMDPLVAMLAGGAFLSEPPHRSLKNQV